MALSSVSGLEHQDLLIWQDFVPPRKLASGRSPFSPQYFARIFGITSVSPALGLFLHRPGFLACEEPFGTSQQKKSHIVEGTCWFHHPQSFPGNPDSEIHVPLPQCSALAAGDAVTAMSQKMQDFGEENSLCRFFLPRFCKQNTSSLAGAIPSVSPKGFRPLEADIGKSNTKFKEKRGSNITFAGMQPL